jgi:hypothetical protein
MRKPPVVVTLTIRLTAKNSADMAAKLTRIAKAVAP